MKIPDNEDVLEPNVNRENVAHILMTAANLLEAAAHLLLTDLNKELVAKELIERATKLLSKTF